MEVVILGPNSSPHWVEALLHARLSGLKRRVEFYIRFRRGEMISATAQLVAPECAKPVRLSSKSRELMGAEAAGKDARENITQVS